MLNERLFYNTYKYRIRMFLYRGLGLLRHNETYTSVEDLRSRLSERYNSTKNYPLTHLSDLWNLSADELVTLEKLYFYRENFDVGGKIRVECPCIDFYTNNLDYYKIAEDQELNPELCISSTDQPNTIVVKKLPFESYNYKCITRYSFVPIDIVSALIDYEYTGEIKFPWNWTTRKFILSTRSAPLPNYIYAQDEQSVTWINLIAGDVIGTVYSYIIDK